jgi:endo-1,4-beta-xylanase
VLAGAAAWPEMISAAPGPAGGGLASCARLSGRIFGSAVRADRLAGDEAFARRLVEDCGGLTPELELKWAAVEPRRSELDFGPMDSLAAFAHRFGLRLHGHTLLWHGSIPAWAVEDLAQARDWTPVERWIRGAVTRYGSAIPAWDVVNEPIDPGGPGGLRQSPFLEAFGPDYVRRALETARSVAPRARLMLNEYGLEYDDAEGRARRRAMLALIDRLRAANAPLDGVGLQAHLDLARGRIPQRALGAFLGELAARDLTLLVTELDVKEADYAASAERRDARVGAAVASVMEVWLDQPRLAAVTTWGLTDRYSWLEVTPADLARHPGAWRDGSSPGLNRGLPLDSSLRAKPMYDALLSTFRSTRCKTAAAGII